MKKLVMLLTSMSLMLSTCLVSLANAAPRPQDVKLWNSYATVLEKCGTPNISTNEQGFVVWEYSYDKYAYSIIFNKDGRVISVQCVGYQTGRVATSDIVLGDSIKRAYALYGWPDNTVGYDNKIRLVYKRKNNISLVIAPNANKKLVVQGIIISAEDIET